MSMTDPIADFLTRIRNSISAQKINVKAPYSKLKVNIATVLKKEGYIKDFKIDNGKPFRNIVIELKYGSKNKPAIEGIKRVSRPGQRIYSKTDELPRVRQGLGITIVTTSKGVMTDKDARQNNIGGELVCTVW
ncbi:MAG: 30S ribosomal protein S8 [Deltaproteobacteria bacterium]|jgi:small subunit ribosomal protein S8|nr:30S ribosomal protein S8 [Deltaproteobacteria bacterium]